MLLLILYCGLFRIQRGAKKYLQFQARPFNIREVVHKLEKSSKIGDKSQKL